MNFLYLLLIYILLLITSLIIYQIINVKIEQRHGPINYFIYLINSVIPLITLTPLLFLSICVVFIFYFYPNNNLLNIIALIPLVLMFPINDNQKYCKTSKTIVLLINFIIILFAINHSLFIKQSYYLLYNPFTLILFIIGIINNMFLSQSNNYSKFIIRITSLNFLLICIFVTYDFLMIIFLVFSFNLIQIFFSKILPKLNSLVSIYYYSNFLLLPILFSFVCNYIWWYFFKEKSLLYFMGF